MALAGTRVTHLLVRAFAKPQTRPPTLLARSTISQCFVTTFRTFHEIGIFLRRMLQMEDRNNRNTNYCNEL